MATPDELREFYGAFYEQAYTGVGVFQRLDAEKEVDSALQLLGAAPGSHVLDWCGGWGRHAIPMLRRGYRVTLLDLSPPYIERARREAAREHLPLDAVVADFRDTPAEIQAEYAVNLFSAGLGHGAPEEDRAALASLHRALRPGARFLLDTIALPGLMRRWAPVQWSESSDGARRLLRKSAFDFLSNRLTSTLIYQDKTADTERTGAISMRVYSPAELLEMCRQAGFDDLRLYGDLDGGEFTLDSWHMVLVGRRD